MPNEPTDAELVKLARAGDAEAFGELVCRHVKVVYAVARSFAQNHADADDLSQEAFLRAYRALRTFRGRSQFRAWLLRITVNLCLNYAQRRRPLPGPAGDLASVPDPGPEPGEVASARELDGAVRAMPIRPPVRQGTLPDIHPRLPPERGYAGPARVPQCGRVGARRSGAPRPRGRSLRHA